MIQGGPVQSVTESKVGLWLRGTGASPTFPQIEPPLLGVGGIRGERGAYNLLSLDRILKDIQCPDSVLDEPRII